MKKRSVLTVVMMGLVLVLFCCSVAFADEGSGFFSEKKDLKHFIKVETCESDNEYSKAEHFGKDNPHLGIDMGQFYITGYTSIKDDEAGNILVIKGEDDEIKLSYDLRSNINNLCGDGNQIIPDDFDGSDQIFGYARPVQGFGRGALLWRFRDYSGYVGEVKMHRDYFVAMNTDKAEKEIILNEEGDWEFALDYEIRTAYGLWGWCFRTDRYTQRFRIQVRNANCIAYLRDIQTGRELKDQDTTANGFIIDLANSHYLKLEVVRKDIDEMNVLGNSIYADGASFKDNGVYTVSVTNMYTGANTTKTITVKAD